MIAKRIVRAVQRTGRRIVPRRPPQSNIAVLVKPLEEHNFHLLLRNRTKITFFHHASGVEVVVNLKNPAEANKAIQKAIEQKNEKMRLPPDKRIQIPGQK